MAHLISVISNDDDCSLERHSSAEGHVTGNGQVVKLKHIRNGSKSFQEVADL